MAGLVEKAALVRQGVVMRGPTGGGISSGKLFGGESAQLLSIRRRSNSRIGLGGVGNLGPQRWRASFARQDDTSGEQQKVTKSPYFTDKSGLFNVQDSNFFKRPHSNKGWDDNHLLAQLRFLAAMADDRAEMHAAVSTQRDNWGKLLQVTIIMSMVSAAILSALNTRPMMHSFSLSLTSALLSAGSIVFMSLENWFQPSQLAEEQRAATRFFRNLVKEIETALKPGGNQFKEEAKLFYEAKLERLQYLDKAFPLPLFPGGIDKFPKEVGPSVLSAPVDLSKPEVKPTSQDSNNGWTPEIIADLKRTSDLLKKADINTYVGWEKNALKINKVLAISGPLFALVSVVSNFMGGPGAAVAAGSCVLAALSSSFSHDAQVGMVYEMYREVAGSFEDIDKEIQRNLRLPVDEREDGELFHQKIALQLGRIEGQAIVSSDDQESAGTLL